MKSLSLETTRLAPRVRARFARPFVVAATVAISSIAAACGGDSSTGPAPKPNGNYPMTTARGLAVPRTFTDAAGSKLTIEGGGIVMNADGTYALNYKGKLNALTFNLTDEGTYKLAGAVATFTPEDGDPAYTGRVTGRNISVDDFKIAGAKFDLGFKN